MPTWEVSAFTKDLRPFLGGFSGEMPDDFLDVRQAATVAKSTGAKSFRLLRGCRDWRQSSRPHAS
jgi:hypothetical protein